MAKKLSKYGNSLALIIDKPILEVLNISEKTKLKISTDGKKIIIEPENNSKKKLSDDEKLKKITEKIIEEFGPALEKLAK